MATEVKRAGLTVVITGTSSGIGKGVAQQLAAQGANVVLAARRTKEIEALADSCGPNAIAVTADVSREEDGNQFSWHYLWQPLCLETIQETRVWNADQCFFFRQQNTAAFWSRVHRQQIRHFRIKQWLASGDENGWL